MADSGLEVVVQDSAPGRPNVIGTLRSANPVSGKSLMLNGHTDTVGFGKMDIDPLDPLDRTYRLRQGDTLWSLSKRFYGTGQRWRDLVSANPSRFDDIHSIRVGTTILIPR